MNKNNEETHKERLNDWIDSTMNSYRGRKNMAPPEDLFERIEEVIDTKKISSRKLNWYVPFAAAIVLFLVNTAAVLQYIQISKSSIEQSSDNYLINDYNLYEYE